MNAAPRWDPVLVEEIASTCHAAAGRLQDIANDGFVSVPWIHLDEETREIVRAGVRYALDGATPRQIHEQWTRNKAACGWARGERDELGRRHPNMVPWDELPPAQQRKNRVFCGIVGGMRPQPDGAGLDDGETYGETYWRASGGEGGAGRWPLLSDGYRGRVEAGAQAVAARVRGERCPDCGQRGGPCCDDGIRNLYRSALERLADEDTPVLGEGLGGGAQEELHVRASFAAHTLGRDPCGCTDCTVSLGLEPDL